MKNTILRAPDSVVVLADGAAEGVHVIYKNAPDSLSIHIWAEQASAPRLVELRWNHKKPPVRAVKVCGDSWERGYSDFEWRGIVPDRVMPWYFFADDGRAVSAYGVMVRPNSFASWCYDDRGITLILDVRNGGFGVKLGDRILEAATVVEKFYRGGGAEAAFNAAADFCRVMCADPLLPKAPIYGGNNWYYAYGNTSADEVYSDARLISELVYGDALFARGCNPPYMVLDDGWHPNRTAGPWVGNERFPDMAELAKKIKSLGVRPGLWVRFLEDKSESIPDSWKIHRERGGQTQTINHLDPSHPEVTAKIKDEVRRFTGWGYKLIKHDFSFFDTFGRWGRDCKSEVCEGGRVFHDRTRTTAEITLDFYRAILDASEGKAYILGCNCASHLAAGLVHINRVGDDTSGVEWERVRSYGVNTAAFRACQHNTFYAVDYDCIGVIPNNIDWSQNSRWLALLAGTRTPLFLSCAYASVGKSERAELAAAFKIAAEGTDAIGTPHCVPLDWQNNAIPSKWKINDKIINFDWYNI